MKTTHTFLALYLLLICACRSAASGDDTSDSIVQGLAFPSDGEVLAAPYDNLYEVPDCNRNQSSI